MPVSSYRLDGSIPSHVPHVHTSNPVTVWLGNSVSGTQSGYAGHASAQAFVPLVSYHRREALIRSQAMAFGQMRTMHVSYS